MSGQNKLMNYLQMAQPGPYDEEASMPMPISGGGAANAFLNSRLGGRGVSSTMQQYMTGQVGPRRQPEPGNPQGGPAGSDIEMLMIYGPEDQVAYDPSGKPIPLADPGHPRNQIGSRQPPTNSLMPMPYAPQQRR